MALSDAQIYNGDGSTRDFTILGEILSESHLRVWIDDVLQSSDDWDLLGNTVLFNDAPDDGANVQFLVSTTGTDFPSNPSAIGDVSININDVITVAANIGIINTVSTNINDAIAVSSNIDNVNDVASNKTNIDAVVNNKTNIDTVATNISKVTTVADDTVAINEIYNNRLEIYEADNNALIATNKASEASTSASNAQLRAWEAEAEAMTSESYATEAVGVFVKEYTSNGDGTFSSTNTTDYSAFHWSEKSKDSSLGAAVNISYDNSTSNLTSNNVQDGLDEIVVRPSGFKNHIINGNFDIWQRGTSQTATDYGSDDRWKNDNVGSAKTHSRQPCTDTERVLFNAMYYSRTVVSSVASASNLVAKHQRIEDITKLAGKTVTLSFWARADSNKNISFGVLQLFGSGGTPSTGVDGIGVTTFNLTSTWKKFTQTVDLPSIIGKTLGTDGVHTTATMIEFWFDAGSTYNTRTNSLGQQSGTFDIAQVQLEEGSVATPFEQRPYGLELSLCQRYYEEVGVLSEYINGCLTTASGLSRDFYIYWAVHKRVPPTVICNSYTHPLNVKYNTPGVYSFYMNVGDTTTLGRVDKLKASAEL